MITKYETNRIHVQAVGVVKVYSKLEHRIYLPDKIRIATLEEITTAEETPIPKLKELKEES